MKNVFVLPCHCQQIVVMRVAYLKLFEPLWSAIDSVYSGFLIVFKVLNHW